MATIVMTGATSGIGAVAASALARIPATRLIVGARGGGASRDADAVELDLASLASVRQFADVVRRETSQIDALVLNAGLSRSGVSSRTVDGFETTFAVNHLGHYLLLRLLLARLAPGAVVVMTTSGTHNPAERTFLPPPRHADARLLAYPDRDPELDPRPRTAGGRAYASSKLCTILTARAFAGRPEVIARRITVVAYDPGPTPGTGLIREAPLPVRIGWWALGTPLFRPLVRRFNSRATAGRTLAELALGTLRPPAGRLHAALRHNRLTWPDPSELAQRDDVADQLWHDSAALVGLQGGQEAH